MLTIAPGLKVYLACKPVDMRRGFDGLAADVAQVLRADPYSGAVFIFRSRRGDYLKILAWDGSGLCLFAKDWSGDGSSGRRSWRAAFVSRPRKPPCSSRGSTGGARWRPLRSRHPPWPEIGAIFLCGQDP